MNITESVIKDFKKFCKNEFPEKKISATQGYGYIYVQAGINNGTFLHYEYYQKQVQLHCESNNANLLEMYIKNNNITLPKFITKKSWQKNRFRWINTHEINSISDLHKAYIEIRDIFEPIIHKFENNLPYNSIITKQEEVPDASAKVLSVNDLLNLDIRIPSYQRPYKWSEKNIDDLLNDIKNAITLKKVYKDSFKYRVGSIILHENLDTPNKYDIVDGQQRLISLTLIAKYLGYKFKLKKDPEYSVLQRPYTNKISQTNIFNNYRKIKEWFTFHEDSNEELDIKKEFLDSINNLLEVVIITVHKEAEAFQLFDSQNNRGKALEPHDLLKAYHLREMRNEPYEMMHAVERWESIKSETIGDLFEDYLYPILKWSQQEKSTLFTTKQIDLYKGINVNSDYTYAKRVFKAMPLFQITEPFIAGESFFNFIEHYLKLLTDIKTQLNNYADEKISTWLQATGLGAGYNYARNLFYAVFLAYYDKFHNFNPMVIKKLFTWAFMIRVDMQHLGEDTIRKYAIGEDAGYSNAKPIFKIIRNARLETEIAGIKIKYKNEDPNFIDLYNDILRINGETNVGQ